MEERGKDCGRVGQDNAGVTPCWEAVEAGAESTSLLGRVVCEAVSGPLTDLPENMSVRCSLLQRYLLGSG